MFIFLLMQQNKTQELSKYSVLALNLDEKLQQVRTDQFQTLSEVMPFSQDADKKTSVKKVLKPDIEHKLYHMTKWLMLSTASAINHPLQTLFGLCSQYKKKKKFLLDFFWLLSALYKNLLKWQGLVGFCFIFTNLPIKQRLACLSDLVKDVVRLKPSKLEEIVC